MFYYKKSVANIWIKLSQSRFLVAVHFLLISLTSGGGVGGTIVMLPELKRKLQRNFTFSVKA